MAFQPFPTTPADAAAQDLIARAVEANRENLCAGLIDQERYIATNPVGYKCSNWAAHTIWVNGVGWRVCDACLPYLMRGDRRVTLPPYRAFAGRDA